MHDSVRAEREREDIVLRRSRLSSPMTFAGREPDVWFGDWPDGQSGGFGVGAQNLSLSESMRCPHRDLSLESWLEIGNADHRPNTVVKLKWRHIRYDEQGRPTEIRLNGADERTKRDADVAWWLPPEVSKTLIELRTMLREPGENDPILPWMDGWGNIHQHEEMTENHLRSHWERLRTKYNLPKLTMRDVRHWVSAQCKDARLEEQARAYLMGHEQPIYDMGDAYDNRPVETNLARQQEKFPNGPLGLFSKVEAEFVNEIPDDLMTALLGYREGNVKATELLDKLETWRLKSKEEALQVRL